MKHITIFILLVQAAFSVMAQDSAANANATTQEVKPLLEFLKYDSAAFQPRFRIDYTPGWIINEMRGEEEGAYETLFTEPKQGINYRANFMLAAIPLKRNEIKAQLLKIVTRIAYDYQYRLSAQVSEPKVVGITSYPAWEVTLTYRGQDPFRSGLVEDVVRKMIIFRLGNTAMVFYYENNAAKFELYNRLFEYTLLSLEFL